MFSGTGGTTGDDEATPVSLHKKRTLSLKKQLDEINQELSPDFLRNLDEVDISMHLELVERLRASFDDAQSSLEAENHSELSSEVSWSFAKLHMVVKGNLTRELNQRKASVAHSSTVCPFAIDDASPSFIISQRNRLPELHIPNFNGAYTEWPEFIAMFNSVINNCTELSKIEKFQHLRANLRGAALDTIRSLEPSDANYDKALELLNKRFGNKLLNFQAHIKEIFTLKNVENGCASGLRSFSDKLNAHLRSLQTMATGEQIADGLLIHLVSQKFDLKTQIKWEEDLPTNTLPTWTSMATFLEKRCRMLENVAATVPAANNISVVGKRAPNGNNNSRKALVASSSVCSFCGSNGHWIYGCSQFGALSPASRYKEAKRLQLCLNCLRQGHSLNKCKSGHCRQCTSKHHSLLHLPKGEQSTPLRSTSNNEVETPPMSSARVQQVATAASSENFVLLATAIILIKNHTGCYVPCRALLDSASQVNFLTWRLVNNLKIQTRKISTSISGIGESNFIAERAVDIFAKAHSDDFTFSFEAIVANSITDNQPNFDLSIDSWNIPPNTKLADPLFYKSQRIDVLLGASLFFDLMCVGQIKLAKNLPILQKTRLGWVASGGGLHFHKSSALVSVCSPPEEEEEDASLNDLVKQFWEVESCSVLPTQTQEEIDCELHFQQNYVRLDSGEYAVRLPLNQHATNLGDSYTQAKQRFLNLERKLQQKPDIKSQYSSFMKEYAKLEHMSPARLEPELNTVFLPHHCVHKADSTTTKLRVVFDGSAKSTSGYSLNDALMVGPTIQPKLFTTLLRFRMFRVALTGDICKMYRCVRILHPDNYLQCILWRDDPKADLKVYTLDTVTYGTRSAAFLAIRAMHQLATDEEANFPLGALVVRRDFYVDDLITGADTLEEVIEIRRQTTQLLHRGNFVLRKWCSNFSASLDGVSKSDCEPLLQFRDGTHITKALGLVWDPNSDNFIFSLAPMKNCKHVTKRIALSTIARFYDPLGLIAPILTQAKIFIQSMWKQRLHWDESLPQHLHKGWTDFCGELELVSNLHFPRYVLMPNSLLELHAFCDASLVAYGACVYVRAQHINKVTINLLCSKSRVAPLKTLTIPKLELCAALLLAELLESIRQTHIFDCRIHCWSDSTVVLSWLREESSNFNIFVSNRVSRIQSLTAGMLWHHIPTAFNPADILSRGSSPRDLLNSQLWMHGPSFLLGDQKDWPPPPDLLKDLPERRHTTLAATIQLEDISLRCKYLNSFRTMQRVFAYVSRFMARKNPKTVNKYGALTPEDINLGTKILLRLVQQIHFAPEYKTLKVKRTVESSSSLYALNQFLDDFGLIRVGGRLENSILDYEARHPIILPKRHPITVAIIQHFHQKFCMQDHKV